MSKEQPHVKGNQQYFKFVLWCFMVFVPYFCHAQSAKPWMRGDFPKIPRGQSYQFKIGKGGGKTLFEAQQKAVFDFLTGLPGFVNLTARCQNKIVGNFLPDATSSAIDVMECDDTVSKHVKSMNARLDQYDYRETNGNYVVYYLFVYMDHNLSEALEFAPLTPTYTDKYGMAAGARSAIIPGWGQFHKRSISKGGLFISGFTALAATTAFYEKRRADNMRKSQETNDIDFIREFRNRADRAQTFRNIAGIATVGIWVFNIVDAISAKGALKYDYKNQVQFYASANRVGVTLIF